MSIFTKYNSNHSKMNNSCDKELNQMTIKPITKKKVYFINSLLILFLTHGFLFFLYPEDIYNTSSPIRYIKYILIIFILLASFKETNKSKLLMFSLTIITLLSMNLLAVGNQFNIIFFLNHIIPMSIYFFYEGISKYVLTSRLAVITYITLSLFGYFEYFLYRQFTIFADAGYRIVSIFINPNNLGLVIIMLFIYISNSTTIKSRTLNMMFFVNSFLLIYLSGSRNSLLIFLMVTLLYTIKLIKNVLFVKKVKTESLVLTGILAIVILVVLAFESNVLLGSIESILMNTRSFDITNMFRGRLLQYNVFFRNLATNVFFPNQISDAYTDNLYLHIWGYWGFPTLLFFLVLNLALLLKAIIKKKRPHLTLLLVFLIAGMAENFIYFWPMGYFYWFLVGSILENKQSILNSNNKECY